MRFMHQAGLLFSRGEPDDPVDDPADDLVDQVQRLVELGRALQ